MVLKVKDKEYKVKFGYNSFCDTDLMDRTTDLLKILQGAEAEDDKDLAGLGMIREVLICVRDLLYVGFQKYNPVETKQEIGEILDDYKEEEVEGENRGIMTLFIQLASELTDEGFLREFFEALAKTQENIVEPQDHKKKQK